MAAKLKLSPLGCGREHHVAMLASQGLTDREMAERLGISVETVGTYWKRLLVRLGAKSRTEAVTRQLTVDNNALIAENHRLRLKMKELNERSKHRSTGESLTPLRPATRLGDEGCRR